MSGENLENNEASFMEGSGVYMKSTFNVHQGTFCLTSERFIFLKRSGLFNAVAGPLLMHLAKGSKPVFEIEHSNLKSIHSEKQGFGSKLIFTTTQDEKFALQFNTNKEKWLMSIQDAVKNYNPMIKVSKIGENYTFSLDQTTVTKSSEKSSDEALSELKKAKDKFDLELITQEEYNKIKEDLRKFIS